MNVVNEWREFQEATEKKEVKKVKRRLLQNQETWRKSKHGWVRIKTSSLVESRNKIGAIGITTIDDTRRTTNAWSVTRDWTFCPVAADLEAS